MSVVVVEASAPLVDLELAKHHLRVDHSADDELITLFLGAAQGGLDGPSGWLGRAIGQQVLEAEFDGLWASFCEIDLPCPPLLEVQQVSDISSVQPTLLSSTQWTATRRGVRLNAAGVIRRARVRYKAGYAATPAPIVAAVLMITADLYANREAQTAVAAGVVQRNPAVEALLAPYRVWRL